MAVEKNFEIVRPVDRRTMNYEGTIAPSPTNIIGGLVDESDEQAEVIARLSEPEAYNLARLMGKRLNNMPEPVRRAIAGRRFTTGLTPRQMDQLVRPYLLECNIDFTNETVQRLLDEINGRVRPAQPAEPAQAQSPENPETPHNGGQQAA